MKQTQIIIIGSGSIGREVLALAATANISIKVVAAISDLDETDLPSMEDVPPKLEFPPLPVLPPRMMRENKQQFYMKFVKR